MLAIIDMNKDTCCVSSQVYTRIDSNKLESGSTSLGSSGVSKVRALVDTRSQIAMAVIEQPPRESDGSCEGR
jgi:hypothetical protein